MLIYAGTKSDFMIDTENDCLEFDYTGVIIGDDMRLDRKSVV